MLYVPAVVKLSAGDVAIPLASATAAPRDVPLERNCTVPVGVAPVPPIVAVKVTVCAVVMLDALVVMAVVGVSFVVALPLSALTKLATSKDPKPVTSSYSGPI